MDLLLLRRLHKWVGLGLGLQLVVWTVSGAAMAMLDHHAVAGEGLSRDPVARPGAGSSASMQALIAGAGDSQVLALRSFLVDGRPTVEIVTQKGAVLLDAQAGQHVIVDRDKATAIAKGAYAGVGAVADVTHHATPPLEAREARGALWAVAFDDAPRTTFYISQGSGEIVERRSRAYRAWDFFWMLHNMDYAKRSSFNHPLIIVAALGAVWIALTGILLLFKVFRASDFTKLARWRT
ncbi:PepSY domain-containing protein [Caulobacter sp. 73W]|uniref:PepSY domain-containing protein n=1 Tax=Caulobacter sp. 73W TaxID=3161137 RepID=A0AB39KT71_9CAUL